MNTKRKPSACALCYASTGTGVAAHRKSGAHGMWVCDHHYEYLNHNAPLDRCSR